MKNFLEINTKKISYYKYGDGDPVILLHGITSSSNTWKELIDDLSKKRTVYTIDFRGHGNSDNFSSYMWSDFSKDILFFIEKIIKKPLDLIGHSLGACIASEVAALSRYDVKNLILEDPPFFHAKRVGVEGVSKRFSYNLSLAKSSNSMNNIYKKLSENTKLSKVRNLDTIAENLSNLDYKVLEETIDGSALSNFNPLEIFENISNVRTLLIVGDEKKTGQVIIQEEIEIMKQKINNLHIEKLDCGHNIHEEKLNDFKKLVLGFLN